MGPWDLFNRQTGDGGWTLIGKKQGIHLLHLYVVLFVLVNYQGLQSETVSSRRDIYIYIYNFFPYGLMFFLPCLTRKELLLPYCDIKSGPIEKDGSTVPWMQQ